MAKVFRSSQVLPRLLTPYEREELQEIAPLPSPEEAPEEEMPSTEDILAEAKAEAARKVQEAYAEGLRRGVQAGKAKFDEAVGQCTEALKAAAGAIQEAHAAFLDSLEPQVIKLVQTITSAILARESRTDPDLVRTAVRQALTALLDRERVIVRVHPDDLNALRAYKVHLLEEFDGVRHLEVHPDESVSPGGCLVDSELMHVDARLEVQLARIFAALTEFQGPSVEPPGSEPAPSGNA